MASPRTAPYKHGVSAVGRRSGRVVVGWHRVVKRVYWYAWCECGWNRTYRRKGQAVHMLCNFHMEDGHGGADD